MVENAPTPTEEIQLTRSEKLMRATFDALVNRCREGIRSGRISVVIDTEEESSEPALKRLAQMLQHGGIIAANHTEPDVSRLLSHTPLKPEVFGSPPMDALILIALVEEMQERNSNLRKVPPMMLRKVEQRDNPKEQTEIDKHVQFDQKSMYHRVRLTGVTPMHNVSRNNQSIAEARQYAREGGIIVVFPEGTTHPAQMDLRTVRTYSGVSEIAEPVTADQISQPVIPIFIKGSEKYAGVLGKGTDKVVIHIGSPQHRQYQQSQTAENALRESRQTRRSFRDRVWGEVVRMQEKYDPAVKHATA